MRAESIVIAGSVAQKPFHGGHTWALLQYVLGFRELGWEVIFLDTVGGMSDNRGEVEFFCNLMERLDLSDSYALLADSGESVAGLSRAKALTHARNSLCLINIMGYLKDDEILGAARQRVFLDIDPGFPQMWRALGLHDALKGYDACVTIAENIGTETCTIPTCGLSWITTPQPIVLSHWPITTPATSTFTTIASWRGVNGPIQYGSRSYGLRVHEFRKFVALPRRTGAPFELALDIHPAEVGDLALLKDNGWSLVDPRSVAGDPWAYQDYIQRSGAEFMVAKNMYVESRSGWISDRSLCYLATGRPVVAQDTGFTTRYPHGEGLLAFSSLDEAAGAVESVTRDYGRHAAAAREIADAYFNSTRVLGHLADKLASVQAGTCI